MSERTEPVPPTRAALAGTAGGTARYSVPETARLLGISERAVRKRITAGTLDAHKEGNAWVVLLPATTGAVPAAPAAPGAVPGAVPEGGTGAVDLAPMAELIDRLTRENQELAAAASTDLDASQDISPLADLLADVTRRNEELAAAASLWQYRAMQAEERLAQLEAGPIAGDVPREMPQDANTGPQSDVAPAETPGTLLGRLRRLLGRG